MNYFYLIFLNLCIALSRENQSDDNNDEIQKSYECKRRKRIAKLVNKECRKARKRVLSNTKEKLEYFSRCPSPIKNLIKGHKGNIKVSEIHSKKLFMLCSKIVNKANVKLPKVYSPLVQNQDESLSDSSSDESYKCKVLSPKHHQVERNLYNSDKALDVDQSPFSPYSDPNSDLSSFASSRRLDKEECESSYKLVNSKIRERVSKALASRHFLFTFDPSKCRIRSPIAQRQRLL